MDSSGTGSEVVIIGGGIAGLAAAVEVARGGAAVTVLERASLPGGRGACRAVGDWRFNLGAHALYRAEGLERLRALGLDPQGAPNASGGLAWRGGALEVLPDTLGGLLSTRLLQAADRWELARVMGRMFLADPAALDGVSLAEWLDSCVRRPVVRQVLEGTVRVLTYANAPDQMSAGLALRQLRFGVKGVLYLHGGWQSLVDGLMERAHEAGVALRCGVDARAVESAGGRATGVRTDGGVLRADAVIVAVTPPAARRLLPGCVSVVTAARDALPSRIAALELGLTTLPEPSRRFVVGLDEPVYYSVHSEARGLGPEGLETVHVAWYREPGDTRDRRGALEALMDAVQPGWRDVVAAQRYLPSLQATTSIPLAARGGARPDVAVPELSGAFLAGDWVGPRGHLVDAVLASAHDAAQAALGALSGAAGRAARVA